MALAISQQKRYEGSGKGSCNFTLDVDNHPLKHALSCVLISETALCFVENLVNEKGCTLNVNGNNAYLVVTFSMDKSKQIMSLISL